MKRLVIAEDHPVFLAALETLISTMNDIEILGMSDSLSGLLDLLQTNEVDVCLTDLFLKDGNVLTQIKAVRQISPAIKIIVLTSSDDLDQAKQAISDGVSSYLLKTAKPEEIKAAIYAALDGRSIVETAVLDSLRNKFGQKQNHSFFGRYPQLTRREAEILALVVEGKTNAEIANTYILSLKTVRNHVSNILTKLGVSTRSAAIALVHKDWDR